VLSPKSSRPYASDVSGLHLSSGHLSSPLRYSGCLSGVLVGNTYPLDSLTFIFHYVWIQLDLNMTPMIDMAAQQKIGKPNHSKLISQLQQQDSCFKHLSYRRIGEWRDKSVEDQIVWSKDTIATVKMEFLPGGHQTHYNIFVSVLQIIWWTITK
jgi:hypothetical protein